MLCLEYLSNPSQINLLVTGTLAANDFHSALPTPMRLLKYSKCLSWSRLCMCFVILLMCHICCVLAYSSLSSFKARGGARNDKVLGFSVLDDSILYTCLLLKHVIVVYHWLFEWGGVSESFCDSDMCRMWLVSVTLEVDYSLINWEIFKGLLLRYFCHFYSNHKIETIGRHRIIWAVGRPTKCEGPCAKCGIGAWSMGISILIGIVSGLIEVCGVSVLLHLLKGQFVSFVISAEHISCLCPTCYTSL